MPIPIKSIGLSMHGKAPRQIPVAVFNSDTGVWSIWIAYSRDLSAGTIVRLFPDGSAATDVLEPTGEMSSFPISM